MVERSRLAALVLAVLCGCSRPAAEPMSLSSAPAIAETIKQQTPPEWRISRIETTDTKSWQVRIAHVIYAEPTSREDLRECVRAVYQKVRQQILDAQIVDRPRRKVIVHVYQTELEDQHDGGSWIAHMLAEKELPDELEDKRIEIVWRSKEFEPPKEWLQRFIELKREAAKSMEPFYARRPNLDFEELQTRSRQTKKRIIEVIAKREGETFEAIRRQVVHVWLWQQARPVTESDIDHWLTEDDGSVLGDRN